MMFISGNRVFQRLPNNLIKPVYDIQSITYLELIEMVKNFNSYHTDQIKILFSLFDKTDQEPFLNHPLCQKVLQNIPDNQIIPGLFLEDDSLTEWHHQTLLSSYNQLNQTGFKLENIK